MPLAMPDPLVHPAHVLHIRKSGGTAVKAALQLPALNGAVILHEHHTRLKDCPAGAPVFFVVRDPIDRFVSGFNCRMRKGRPRYHYPWSLGEWAAFSVFRSPNRLAEALNSANCVHRTLAKFAMRSIRHLRVPLSYWLESGDYLAHRPLVFIGSSSELDSDLVRFSAAIGLPETVALPSNKIDAHVSPPGSPRSLSERARSNLTKWYDADFCLYRKCMEMRQKQLSGL